MKTVFFKSEHTDGMPERTGVPEGAERLVGDLPCLFFKFSGRIAKV